MGQNQVIVLGQLVENGPGGTGGANGVHGFDVTEQGQAADDVVLVDKGFNQNVCLDNANMRQVFLHVADGIGEDPVGEGRVQQLAIQGIAVDDRLGRLGGGFGGRLGGRFGSCGGFRHGGGSCGRGFLTAAAAKQQRQG